jgi:hypothetical protein
LKFEDICACIDAEPDQENVLPEDRKLSKNDAYSIRQSTGLIAETMTYFIYLLCYFYIGTERIPLDNGLPTLGSPYLNSHRTWIYLIVCPFLMFLTQLASTRVAMSLRHHLTCTWLVLELRRELLPLTFVLATVCSTVLGTTASFMSAYNVSFLSGST